MAMTFDEFLKAAAGPLEMDWRKYRRRAARRHVEERLEELGLPDFSAYLEFLSNEPLEARRLPDIMRVTVSRFFRDGDCWRELTGAVLPQLLAGKQGGEPAGEPLWALSIGCCNGEEPYSLAIALLSLGHDTQVEILATDIDEMVLERARAGCYGEGSLREVPDEILARFFHPEGNLMCIEGRVKSLVRFERRNIMEDPLPGKMDLILCRYLAFTYYEGGRRRQAAERLWQVLRPGGALMIGRKEALGPDEADLFKPWPGTGAIFKRR